LVRGRVISFDRVKGYGFVAPEIGGEDVFIHVNDLYSDKSLLTAGSTVEFELEDGERGPKAAAITVIRPAEVSPAQVEHPGGAGPLARPAEPEGEGEGERMADVLTPDEFAHEFTEALLRVEPELGSRQILEIRKRFARICQAHGWVDR
jgi:cold shock CspA family protein